MDGTTVLAVWLGGWVLGLAGSLHCAGMCGPLTLAMPGAKGSAGSMLATRAAYNLGRVATYGMMGLVAGVMGQVLAWAGFQRGVSILLGILVLAGVVGWSIPGWRGVLVGRVGWLKRGLSFLLSKRGMWALFLLGLLNGLLPCGLVYVACAGAATAGGALPGGLFMVGFGMGTVPVMLLVSLGGGYLGVGLRLRLQRVVPWVAGAMGVLLVVRGLGLGIPYVSPAWDAAGRPGVDCCRRGAVVDGVPPGSVGGVR